MFLFTSVYNVSKARDRFATNKSPNVYTFRTIWRTVLALPWVCDILIRYSLQYSSEFECNLHLAVAPRLRDVPRNMKCFQYSVCDWRIIHGPMRPRGRHAVSLSRDVLTALPTLHSSGGCISARTQPHRCRRVQAVRVLVRRVKNAWLVSAAQRPVANGSRHASSDSHHRYARAPQLRLLQPLMARWCGLRHAVVV